LDIPEGESVGSVINLIFVADSSFLLYLMVLILLIISSGLISGSEVAFFSIKGNQSHEFDEDNNRRHKLIIELLSRPRTLLATILIANNVVNIAIVMVFALLSAQYFNLLNPVIEFLVNIVAITFILVLLGEIIPKVYANRLNLRFATSMVYPMFYLTKMLYPFSYFLVRFTSIIEKRISKKGHEVSISDLKDAIDLTAVDSGEGKEKQILKGLVNFGNITVKQIMTSRVDVEAYDHEMGFQELLNKINKSRYSRIPVYEESLDRVKGVLYVKDLIPHLSDHDFKWQEVVRAVYFVPENKKIDDLLKEFQDKKVHMAVVVDEYGGTSGIITLEDILEEIVGEINDEFDEDEVFYSVLDDNTYIFDGKTSLTDFARIINFNEELFDEYKN